MRRHLIPSTLLALLAAVAAAPTQAQVRPVEPFGGRPFGAPPDDGAAPQPQGTTMGAPGMSSVQPPGTPNPGTPPAVIVAPVQVPAPPPAPVQPPPPPAQVPPPAAAAAPATQAPQPAPAAAAPAPAAPAPAPTAAPAPAPSSSLTPPFTGGAANPNRNAPPAAAAAATPGAPQQPVRGLPADAPKLVISGSVYSPDRAKRVLIVNGQMAHEGADLGQGVVLEEVRHEGAVLGYKGSRYSVVF